MNPIPYDECSEEEQIMRDMAAECAEEELRDAGCDDDEFIECVLEDILAGESVDVHLSNF